MSKDVKPAVTRLYKDVPLLSQSLLVFTNEVALDESFNRQGCWTDPFTEVYLKDLIVGFAPSPIIVADLKKCAELCLEGSKEYEYFQKWIDKGYLWLAIDGNNRTVSIRKYLNNEIGIEQGEITIDGQAIEITKSNNSLKTHPAILKEYIDNHVMVVICEYTVSSRQAVSDLFLCVNGGIALREQEKRNAILCGMADEIRAMVAKYKDSLTTGKIYKNNIRYKLDELLAKLAVIYAYRPESGVSQNDLWDAYRDESTTYKAFIQKGKYNGRKLIDNACRLIKKYEDGCINPSSFINLFMALYAVEDNSREIKNEEEFYKWFKETENARLASMKILVTNKKGSHTYLSLRENSTSIDLTYRYEEICLDLKSCEYISIPIELDPTRLFTPTQRFKAWEKQKGICVLTNKVIPQSEINDITKWEADHKIAYSKGGKTDAENCQLVCKIANRQKGSGEYQIAA